MTTITLDNIPDSKKSLLTWDEFELLLEQFILDYIETKEDLILREDLKNDDDFLSLNFKLEEELWKL